MIAHNFIRATCAIQSSRDPIWLTCRDMLTDALSLKPLFHFPCDTAEANSHKIERVARPPQQKVADPEELTQLQL